MGLLKNVNLFLQDDTRKMAKKDWILVAIITVVYAALSFINLGSFKNPQTFANFTENEEIVFELVEKSEVSKIRYFVGDSCGDGSVLISSDGKEYTSIEEFSDLSVFAWKDTGVNQEAQYIKIIAKDNKAYFGEIQAYDENGNKLQMSCEQENGKLLIDEPDTVPDTISYMNSSYFDEVYFPRACYEYLHGITVYEWVHPPVGKLIQMIPVALFGMTPFAYRLMGNIAGILMVGIMYIFGKTMFKDRKYALLAGFIMMFDNFHFAQTRMGTVDSFLVLFEMISALFMFKYLLLGNEDTLKQKRKYLFWSGLFFGLSVCVKWTGLYSGLGLCILFFGKMILDTVRDKKFNKEYIKIMLACVYFFVIIPCAIYIFSYLLFPNVEPRGNVSSIGAIFTQIGDMYEYHSTLEATHSFTSPWYTWPVMKRPVWLYVSYLEDGIKGTITGIGNPAVWWIGAATSIVVLIKALKSRKMEDVFILVMILATWLPYAFIGRIMFLYHFFPVLPFIMLSIVSVMKDLTKKSKHNSIIVVYMVIVIILFFAFYPVTSGIPVSEKYINGLRWLKSWYF